MKIAPLLLGDLLNKEYLCTKIQKHIGIASHLLICEELFKC